MGKLISMSNDAITEFRRRQVEDGYTFPLQSTFAGYDEEDEVPEARIRRISSLDEAVLESLPQDVQDTVWQGMTTMREFQAKARNRTDPTNLNEMMANNREILKAASEWCIASFIQPKLVRAAEEVRDNNTWVVDKVHPEDRVNVFVMSMDNDSEALKKLKLFRPERQADAQDHAPVSTAATSLRTLEPVGAGVHAEPVS